MTEPTDPDNAAPAGPVQAAQPQPAATETAPPGGALRRRGLLARLISRKPAEAAATSSEPQARSPANVAPPVWWHPPTRFEQRSKAAYHFFAAVRDGLLLVAVLAAAGLAAYFGHDEWSDDRPLIGKIEVPRELEEAGYSSTVVARMLSDELHAISQSSLVPVARQGTAFGPATEAEPPSSGGASRGVGGRLMTLSTYRSDPIKGAAFKESATRTPEFEVVGVGFSLHDVIRVLKAQLDSLPLEIGGEVVRAGRDYGYVLRLDGERVESIRGDLFRDEPLPATAATGKPASPPGTPEAVSTVGEETSLRLKQIMIAAALAILKHTQPVSWAIQGYAQGRRAGLLPVVNRFLICPPAPRDAEASTVVPPPAIDSLDIPRAWLLKGYVERDNDNAAAAERAFQCARDTALGFEPDNDDDRMRRSVVLAKAFENLKQHDEAKAEYVEIARSRPNNAAILMGWASLLASIGDFVFAAEKFQEAAVADPGQIDALVALARVQARLGRAHLATATFERASEIAPLDAADQLDWGYALSALGHFRAAAERYAEAVKLDPDSAAALQGWSNMLWTLGQYEQSNHMLDQAIVKFQTAVRRDPLNTVGRIGLALAHVARNQPAEADQEFARAVESAPKDPEPLYHWGIALLNRGAVSEAIERLRDLIALDPAPWNHLTLGDALWRAGDVPAAKRQFDIAVEIFRARTTEAPDDPANFKGLGQAHLRLEQFEEARVAFARNVALDPENAHAITDLASTLATLKQFGASDQQFERATHLDPASPGAVFAWARELARRGAFQRAAELFERLAMTLDPANPWNYVDWGDALVASGPLALAEARRVFGLAAERFEAELAYSFWPVALHSGLASVRLKAGEPARAIEAFDKLAALGAANAWDYLAWGDALAALGKAADARLRHEDAAQRFKADADARPDDPVRLRDWATSLDRLGRRDDAAAAYGKVAALTVDDPWDHVAWAEALMAAGKQQEADRAMALSLDAFEAALKRQSAGSNAVLVGWATTLGRLGRHAEAAAKWAEAAKLAPGDPWPMAARGEALSNAGRSVEARAAYERAVPLFAAASVKSPRSPELLAGWANALIGIERYQDAADKFAKAVELDPGNARLQIDAGRAAGRVLRYDQALALFERATKIDASNPDAWFFWGVTLAHLNRFGDAAEKFEQATKLDPQDAQAYAQWGNALEALGKSAEAAEKFRRADELGRPPRPGQS